jgi:PhnB protein
MMRLNPYLGFRDDARAAIEFYRSVFGGEFTITTFGDFHASDDPAEFDKVMHAQLETDAGFTLMASDTPQRMAYNPGDNITVSLSGDDTDQLTGYWQKLSEGATISMPLDVAPWGDTFGMLTDRFGIPWMVSIANPS